jgi:hypothetical protein
MKTWKSFFLFITAFLFWTVGLVIVGQWDYDAPYFWASECAIAIGFAVAPFWRHRRSSWYWPTIVLLSVLNLAALLLIGAVVEHELPSKGNLQLLSLADCMACWALMVGVARLADGRFPWND